MADFSSKYGIGDKVVTCRKKQIPHNGYIVSVSFYKDSVMYQVCFQAPNGDEMLLSYGEQELQPRDTGNE